MRVAIAYALHHPDRADLPIPTLDLVELGPLSSRRPTWTRSRACGWRARPALAGGTAPCVLNAANEVAVHAFLAGRLCSPASPRSSSACSDTLGAARVHDFEALYVTDAEARALAGELIEGGVRRMSWVLAFLGFAALIILHEFGHFAAAKAVGMRVERFALFFPPLLLKVRRGETEYGIGAIPLGGYVRITGMNPREEHPAGGRAPRLLPPARVEADRGHRRRAGGQHRRSRS